MKLLTYRPVAEPSTALALTTPCSAEVLRWRVAFYWAYYRMAEYSLTPPVCEYTEKWPEFKLRSQCLVCGGEHGKGMMCPQLKVWGLG